MSVRCAQTRPATGCRRERFAGHSDTKAVTVTLGAAIGRVLVRFSVAQPVFTDGAVISYGLSLSLCGAPPRP
jgi:hypothetical protein